MVRNVNHTIPWTSHQPISDCLFLNIPLMKNRLFLIKNSCPTAWLSENIIDLLIKISRAQFPALPCDMVWMDSLFFLFFLIFCLCFSFFFFLSIIQRSILLYNNHSPWSSPSVSIYIPAPQKLAPLQEITIIECRINKDRLLRAEWKFAFIYLPTALKY